MPGRRLTYLDRGPAPQRARTRLLCIDVSVSLFICLPLYVYSCNIQLQHADPYILQAHPAFGLKPLREYFQHSGSSFAPVLAYVDVDATELIRLVLWSCGTSLHLSATVFVGFSQTRKTKPQRRCFGMGLVKEG